MLDRTVGQSEWDEGKGLWSEERLERGKLERRRRTPVQPESAMRGSEGEIEVRAEGDVVVRACARGKLGRGWLTCAGGGGLGEKEI